MCLYNEVNSDLVSPSLYVEKFDREAIDIYQQNRTLDRQRTVHDDLVEFSLLAKFYLPIAAINQTSWINQSIDE